MGDRSHLKSTKELDAKKIGEYYFMQLREEFDEEIKSERKTRHEVALSNAVHSIVSCMVQIPLKKTSFAIGSHEVTQAEWEFFMGKNPSRFIGDSRPVETVEWDSVQDFLSRLNAYPLFASRGIVLRLPTDKEWKAAYNAAGRGSYLKSRDRTLPVERSGGGVLLGLDGNVSEWLGSREFCGGNYERTREPLSRYSFSHSDGKSKDVGLRLCADWTPELEAAITDAQEQVKQ